MILKRTQITSFNKSGRFWNLFCQYGWSFTILTRIKTTKTKYNFLIPTISLCRGGEGISKNNGQMSYKFGEIIKKLFSL